MKRYFLLICFVSFECLFSQQISFSQLYEYKCNDGKPACQHLVMAQPEGRRYFALLFPKGNEHMLVIADMEQKLSHAFTVDITKTELDDPTTFVYQYTNDNFHVPDKGYVIDFEPRAEDSLTISYHVVHYKNKRKKSRTFEYDVVIEKAEVDQFDAFRFGVMHPFEYDTAYRPPVSGKVVTSHSIHRKKPMTTQLVEISDTNVVVEIPKNRIRYENSKQFKEVTEQAILNAKQSSLYRGGTITVKRVR